MRKEEREAEMEIKLAEAAATTEKQEANNGTRLCVMSSNSPVVFITHPQCLLSRSKTTASEI
jgi:hypothetical protein